MKTELRILAMDPGTSNYAAAVIRTKLTAGRMQYKVEGTSMLDPQLLLSDMKIMREALHSFVEYIRPLMEDGEYDAIIIERFQARGGKGPTIESVSCMLAAIGMCFPNVPVMHCVTAGVWKNAYNLFGDLKETYEDHKSYRKDNKELPHIEIHQLDACLMGLYMASKLYALKPFDFITSTSVERKLMRKLDSSPSIKALPERLPKKRKEKRGKAKRKAKKL